MADTKITSLLTPQVTTNPATDVLPIVNIADTSMASSGSTRKITVNTLLGAGGTATLASATITGALTVDTTTLVVNPPGYADRVGILTASPTHLLDVRGIIKSNGTFTAYINPSFSGAAAIQTESAESLILAPSGQESLRCAPSGVYTFGDGAGGTRMTLNSTGLGIGTSPSYKIHSVVTSGFAGRFNSSTAVAGGILAGNSVADLIVGVDASGNGRLTADTSKYLGLGSGGINDRVILDSSGNLGIANGNVVMTTSGKGIDFSATSGTGTSELLADYEEGTWTIGLTFGGGSTGITTTGNTGRYTKVGRQVTVSGILSLSNKGSSTGLAEITGLPFTIANANEAYSAASVRFNGISFADVPICIGATNSTKILLQEITNAGVVSDITDADFTNTSSCVISFTYTV